MTARRKRKSYTLQLITQGTYIATVRATSLDAAEEQARHRWSNEHPCPFEQVDEELEYILPNEGEEP